LREKVFFGRIPRELGRKAKGALSLRIEKFVRNQNSSRQVFRKMGELPRKRIDILKGSLYG